MSDEEELQEIHGIEGIPKEFNDGNQEGVSVGGRSSSGSCPNTDVILTRNRVNVVHSETREVLDWTDIEFDYQWYDEDDNPVDQDDPTGVRGEPTEPADGAVEEAIKEARSLEGGWRSGWRYRERKGPEITTLEQFQSSLQEVNSVTETGIISRNEEIWCRVGESRVPESLSRWLDDHPTIAITDFEMTEDGTKVFMDRDTSRKSRYA